MAKKAKKKAAKKVAKKAKKKAFPDTRKAQAAGFGNPNLLGGRFLRQARREAGIGEP